MYPGIMNVLLIRIAKERDIVMQNIHDGPGEKQRLENELFQWNEESWVALRWKK